LGNAGSFATIGTREDLLCSQANRNASKKKKKKSKKKASIKKYFYLDKRFLEISRFPHIFWKTDIYFKYIE
jgi:hypothetical protein